MLLYAWQHPERAISLYESTAAGHQKSFYAEDFDIIRPLIIALRGGESDLPTPEFYRIFLERRSTSKNLRRARSLQAAIPKTLEKARKRQLKTQLGTAKKRLKQSPQLALQLLDLSRKDLKRLLRELPRTRSSSSSSSSSGSGSSSPSSSLPSSSSSSSSSSSEEETSDETDAGETRIVRLLSSSSSSDESTEIVIETPAWDDL
jgi:hypothetical protein